MIEIMKKRGFALLSPERRKEIATLGGKSVAPSKRSFSTNKELAKKAGAKGGKNAPAEKRPFSAKPGLAIEAGKLGGAVNQMKAKNKNRGD